MSVHQYLLETIPSFRRAQVRLEHWTGSKMRANALARTGVTVIPTVVHVLWSTAAENISDAQVESQIAALNRDFRAQNVDRAKVASIWRGLVADSRIEFELATIDPAGKKTIGVTRTQTTRRMFSTDDAMKRTRSGGRDPWATDRYLNIWVCALGGGLLGYAQFPGGPKATDGVVILNTAFGTRGTARAPFN
ncbi:MAG: zinc metalloprotease, partial [Burkholderiales bacterium]